MEIMRMCIACRQMKDKRELLRIVKDKENNISIDKTGKKMVGAHIFAKIKNVLQN